MQITPTSTATPAASAREAAPAALSPGSDFQTFLTLLTAQMRNQDPLKPVESTEFIAQLASFSAVEQQVRTNDRLDHIIASLAGGSSAGLAEWIGREVRVPAAASFEGVPVEVEFDPHPQAETATLVVLNAFDQVVTRRAIEADAKQVTWDGRTDTGEMAPNGTYRFTIESKADGQLVATQSGRVFVPVEELRIVEGLPRLVLASGETVTLDAVTAIR